MSGGLEETQRIQETYLGDAAHSGVGLHPVDHFVLEMVGYEKRMDYIGAAWAVVVDPRPLKRELS